MTYPAVESAGPSTRLRIMSRQPHKREFPIDGRARNFKPHQLDVRMYVVCVMSGRGKEICADCFGEAFLAVEGEPN